MLAQITTRIMFYLIGYFDHCAQCVGHFKGFLINWEESGTLTSPQYGRKNILSWRDRMRHLCIRMRPFFPIIISSQKDLAVFGVGSTAVYIKNTYEIGSNNFFSTEYPSEKRFSICTSQFMKYT